MGFGTLWEGVSQHGVGSLGRALKLFVRLGKYQRDNLPFYRSHGFEVMDEIKAGNGGPPMWPILRKPP
jgi:hypothetical protein